MAHAPEVAASTGEGPGTVFRLMLLLVLACLTLAGPAVAETYRCGGELLNVRLFSGAVDAPGIPNSSAGSQPGAFVQLRWRDLTLQLPRTNDAGPASYSDGIWWWSPEDPAHPSFRRRLAEAVSAGILEFLNR